MYRPLKRWHDREKMIGPHGYMVVWAPEHPKSFHGWYYEHRMVVEKQLDRLLRTWETVHHINCDRSDNRYENLFLCSRVQHNKAG